MEGGAVSLLLDVLRIYSPSGSESELASYLADWLNSSGIEARIDRAGNVIAQLGEGRPRLLFCGHLDTVPGRLEVREEAGRIYGRGAVDAKSALAAMAVAASRLAGEDLRGSVIFAAVVDE